MAHILFATDFSPIAQHAATYATHLAQSLQMDLTLLHAYIVPFAYEDSATPLLNHEEVKEIAESSMMAEQSRLQTLAPQLSVTTKIMPGDLISCLQDEINEHPPALVALGTSGREADSILWGSMAIKALRCFNTPVLVIPAKASWRPVHKVGFAADYEKISGETPFSDIISWVNKMKATLSVIHIDRTSTGRPATPPPQLLQEVLAPNNPTYHTISAESIIDGVQNFVRQHEIDWLILIPRKYGFWASLFHKSRTKMLAQVSHIPILALHQD